MTTSQDTRTSNRLAVLFPALALVVGLVLGGVVVGVSQGGDGGDEPSTADVTDAPSEDPADVEPGTAVVVPDSCVELADSAQRAIELVRGGISSVREFRTDEILDLLDDLEDLDALVRNQSSSCTGTTVTDAPLDDAPPDDVG